MKRTLQCPKCEGRQLWRIEKVRERGHLNQLHTFPVMVHRGTWRETAVGTFELFVCARCGYSEWYASALEDLKADPKKGVHLIDTEPEAGLR